MVEKCRKWGQELNMDIPYKEFIQGLRDIKCVTNITKLWSFQYRLLQRSLVTNVDLYIWEIKSSDLCSFCHNERETVIHLFITCNKVAEIWLAIKELMKTFSEMPIHFGADTVLWNRLIYAPKGHVKNLICLVVKHYIYKQRCANAKLTLNGGKVYLINTILWKILCHKKQ